MELRCIRCDAPIQANDINLERFVAKCSHCHAVFRFEAEALETSAKPQPAPKQKHDAAEAREASRPQERKDRQRGEKEREHRQERKGRQGASAERRDRELAEAYKRIPKGVKVEDLGDGLRILRSWWSPMFYILVVFALIWNLFLVGWYSGVTSSMRLSDPFTWIFILFPLLHVGAGVGVTYFCLCMWFNQTIIQLRGGLLSIEHKPLPWFGAKKLSIEELKQLYCKEVVSHSKNGTTVTYEVLAILSNGKHITLLSHLADAEQALFFEEEIEDYLGIEDRPVRGEMRVD